MITYAILSISVYGSLVLGLYMFQRKLIYHPDNALETPGSYGLETVRNGLLQSEENISLVVWHAPARAGYPTILYFHGNAGHLGHRADKFRHFTDAGFGLVTVSYRGYGQSTGTPSEQGLYSDARAAYRFLTETEAVPPENVLIYGESLGTGVAVQIAAEKKAGGLILEAPYTSVTDRSAEMYPLIPARRMLHDKFDSLSKIGNVRMPLLILQGEKDRTIPPRHARKILEAANEPKRAVFYPEVGHTDFDLGAVTKEIGSFAREHGVLKQP